MLLELVLVLVPVLVVGPAVQLEELVASNSSHTRSLLVLVLVPAVLLVPVHVLQLEEHLVLVLPNLPLLALVVRLGVLVPVLVKGVLLLLQLPVPQLAPDIEALVGGPGECAETGTVLAQAAGHSQPSLPLSLPTPFPLRPRCAPTPHLRRHRTATLLPLSMVL